MKYVDRIAMSADDDGKAPIDTFQEACKGNDVETVKRLLESGDVDPNACTDGSSITSLMHAAEHGDERLVQSLLEVGASWQAQDSEGHTAGEYAMGNPDKSVFRLLLEWAVQSEMVLGRESLAKRKEESNPVNEEYLKSTIQYENEKLMDDSTGEAVMMGWEAPLMVKHAKDICWNGGDVLNIGFGMGIIDEEIQKLAPRTHTIIEAHPDVYQHMIRTGWDTKENVRVVFGRWQDVIDDLGPFDGIFFDTYGEYYEDMQILHTKLPKLLKDQGVYSFFNGLAPDNIFFHMVYGEIARRELNELGLRVEYYPIAVDASHQEIWEGVMHRYWHFPQYFVPLCRKCTIDS